MIATNLKKMVDRVSSFCGKFEEAQRCVIERRSNVLYISGSDGNAASKVWDDDEGDNFETAVHVFALKELLDCFKNDEDVVLEVTEANVLMLSNSKTSMYLPTYPTDKTFNIPQPKNWVEVHSGFNAPLQRAIGFPARHLKSNNNLSLAMHFDTSTFAIVNGHVSWFDIAESDINHIVTLNELLRCPPNVSAYCVMGNFIYFRGLNEWCMLPTDSRNPTKYQMLFDQMEKSNTSIIQIAVKDLNDITQKIRSMHRAECTLRKDDGGMQTVKLSITNDTLTAISELGSASIPITTSTPIHLLECSTNIEFITVLGSAGFKQDSAFVELLVGRDMTFLVGRSKTVHVMGGLYKSRN